MSQTYTSLFDAWMAATRNAFAPAIGKTPEGEMMARLSGKICEAYEQLGKAAKENAGFDIKSSQVLQIVEQTLPKNVRQTAPRDQYLQMANAVLKGFEQARTGTFQVAPFPQPKDALQTQEDIKRALGLSPAIAKPFPALHRAV